MVCVRFPVFILTPTYVGLRDLSGNGVEAINTAKYNRLQLDDLWAVLRYNSDQMFPMGCTISVDNSKYDYEQEGLLVNHAYGLTLCAVCPFMLTFLFPPCITICLNRNTKVTRCSDCVIHGALRYSCTFPVGL
jgi:hypothetical protein